AATTRKAAKGGAEALGCRNTILPCKSDPTRRRIENLHPTPKRSLPADSHARRRAAHRRPSAPRPPVLPHAGRATGNRSTGRPLRDGVRGTALVALPPSERAEKIALHIRRERLLRQVAEHVDRPSHLVEMGLAGRTGHDVLVEASAVGRRPRTLKVVRHED